MLEGSQNKFRLMPITIAMVYAVVVVLAHRPAASAVVRLAFGYAAAIGAIGFLLGLPWLLRQLVVERAARATALTILRRECRARWAADRGLSTWQPLATFAVVMTAFTLFKQTALPSAGFVMGPAIADADRWLFGRDAWRVTHGVLSSPWATQAIDLAYHAWFLPMTLGVACCIFAPPGTVLAQRYLLAYVLLWVLQGSALAYWLPAAGPVYFDDFQREVGRFAELGARLADQDAWLRAMGAPGLSALSYQDHLLHLFVSREIALGGGISAMPSLHNAMAVLFACAARRLSPLLGLGFAVYAFVIWIGSIQLGWHYALDGIVALAATFATWKATGWLHFMLGRRSVARPIDPVPASIS